MHENAGFMTGRTVVVIAMILGPLVLKLWTYTRRQRDLPPGPPTVSIIGSTHVYPNEYLQLQLTAWAKEYGNVYSLIVRGTTFIVLSSPATVKYILDKKGAATGGRQESPLVRAATDSLYMVVENIGTEIWKRQRKAMHSFVTETAAGKYLPKQEREYLQLLHDILDTPDDLFTHIKRVAASVMTRLIYDKHCPSYENSEAEMFVKGMELLDQVASIDPSPIWKYVPYQLTPWKRLCDQTDAQRKSLHLPLLLECEQADRGSGCYMEFMLKEHDKFGIPRDEIWALGAALMDGGADSSAVFMRSLVLILITFPECQRRAQEEIDHVIGSGRLPTMGDFDKLPYVNALIKELRRFRPSNPLSFPHISTKDIQYGNYLIPKGSVIIQNTWGICHDPDLFDEPSMFEPERYLKTQFGTKPDADISDFRNNFLFGAGRRICPGEKLALRCNALATMYFLWAFEFTKSEKCRSANGLAMNIKNYSSGGDLLAPNPFNCEVKARDERRAALVRKMYLCS